MTDAFREEATAIWTTIRAGLGLPALDPVFDADTESVHVQGFRVKTGERLTHHRWILWRVGDAYAKELEMLISAVHHGMPVRYGTLPVPRGVEDAVQIGTGIPEDTFTMRIIQQHDLEGDGSHMRVDMLFAVAGVPVNI